MKFIRAIFRFYIQSSMHVALAVTSLAAVTLLEFGLPLNLNLLGFLFFGAIVGYNFVKYTGVSNLHHLEITPDLMIIRGFSILAFLGLSYFAFLMPVTVIFYAAGFGVLTVLYAFPFIRGRNLRTLRGLKVFIIALVWSGFSVILPIVHNGSDFGLKLLYQGIEIFSYVIVLMIPFEIRDLKYDEPELETLPQKLGIRKSKWLGTDLLGVVIFMSFMQELQNFTHLTIAIIIAVISLIFIWNAKEEQGPYYTSFWVEGIPILWLALMFIV